MIFFWFLASIFFSFLFVAFHGLPFGELFFAGRRSGGRGGGQSNPYTKPGSDRSRYLNRLSFHARNLALWALVSFFGFFVCECWSLAIKQINCKSFPKYFYKTTASRWREVCVVVPGSWGR